MACGTRLELDDGVRRHVVARRLQPLHTRIVSAPRAPAPIPLTAYDYATTIATATTTCVSCPRTASRPETVQAVMIAPPPVFHHVTSNPGLPCSPFWPFSPGRPCAQEYIVTEMKQFHVFRRSIEFSRREYTTPDRLTGSPFGPSRPMGPCKQSGD
ncbi:hypothetical protein EVAR_94933_1 [Eumeta japonica]|uniref:Uncharacterized protein n=1 Tax=Eumeta variegata TaxID=151549 RepID=A0A4C1Z860_EUMVA|nr:hypothetical protein EVAR_94933_1 [Eumeta japonica]